MARSMAAKQCQLKRKLRSHIAPENKKNTLNNTENIIIPENINIDWNKWSENFVLKAKPKFEGKMLLMKLQIYALKQMSHNTVLTIIFTVPIFFPISQFFLVLLLFCFISLSLSWCLCTCMYLAFPAVTERNT